MNEISPDPWFRERALPSILEQDERLSQATASPIAQSPCHHRSPLNSSRSIRPQDQHALAPSRLQLPSTKRQGPVAAAAAAIARKLSRMRPRHLLEQGSSGKCVLRRNRVHSYSSSSAVVPTTLTPQQAYPPVVHCSKPAIDANTYPAAASAPLQQIGDPIGGPLQADDGHAAAASQQHQSPKGSRGGRLTQQEQVDGQQQLRQQISGLRLEQQAAPAGAEVKGNGGCVGAGSREHPQPQADLAAAQQLCKQLQDEVGRLRSKVDQRGVEMLIQQQKLQAAQEKLAAHTEQADEHQAQIDVVGEVFEQLVTRVMTVVDKAAVAVQMVQTALQESAHDKCSNCRSQQALHQSMEALASVAALKDSCLQGTSGHLPRKPAKGAADAAGVQTTARTSATSIRCGSTSNSGGKRVAQASPNAADSSRYAPSVTFAEPPVETQSYRLRQPGPATLSDVPAHAFDEQRETELLEEPHHRRLRDVYSAHTPRTSSARSDDPHQLQGHEQRMSTSGGGAQDSMRNRVSAHHSTYSWYPHGADEWLRHHCSASGVVTRPPAHQTAGRLRAHATDNGLHRNASVHIADNSYEGLRRARPVFNSRAQQARAPVEMNPQYLFQTIDNMAVADFMSEHDELYDSEGDDAAMQLMPQHVDPTTAAALHYEQWADHFSVRAPPELGDHLQGVEPASYSSTRGRCRPYYAGWRPEKKSIYRRSSRPFSWY